MNQLCYAVIMAGGSGTRLWPVSRSHTPKQFHALIGTSTLIQETVTRILPVVPIKQIFVVTTAAYAQHVKKQIPELTDEQLIIEPEGRNTTAAIALATAVISKVEPEAVIAVMPADHHVGKADEFTKVCQDTFSFVAKQPQRILTIGINPTSPNTGYGYIKMGESLEKINNHKFFAVDAFLEKPDLATAQKFFDSWEYLWNGGYFFFNANTMLSYLNIHAKETRNLVNEYLNGNNEAYAKIKSVPIDKAIAEKLTADQLAVIPADLDWSDLGIWTTLHEIRQGIGERKNILHHDVGSQDVLVLPKDKLIATIGVKDLVIIDGGDAMLICHKDRVQDVKQLVDSLKENGQEEYI